MNGRGLLLMVALAAGACSPPSDLGSPEAPIDDGKADGPFVFERPLGSSTVGRSFLVQMVAGTGPVTVELWARGVRLSSQPVDGTATIAVPATIPEATTLTLRCPETGTVLPVFFWSESDVLFTDRFVARYHRRDIDVELTVSGVDDRAHWLGLFRASGGDANALSGIFADQKFPLGAPKQHFEHTFVVAQPYWGPTSPISVRLYSLIIGGLELASETCVVIDPCDDAGCTVQAVGCPGTQP